MFLSSFLAVKACSEGVLGLAFGHGKSPCFSRWSALKSVDVDALALFLSSMKMGNFHG
jgi:hypothetical protein